MERIELEYDEFYTQIGKLNRISDLPEQIEFKVSPFAKIALLVLLVGAGSIGGVYTISHGRVLEGIAIILGSIAFYLFLYFSDHKARDKKYIVGKKGITVNDKLFSWTEIDDLHLIAQQMKRGQLISICFLYDGIKKEFQLDTMTKPTGEIKQILYMYQRWWIKNVTH
jgi:hypothetical protein